MHGSNHSRPVGRVAALWRYPVKSMAGEPLSTASVSWHGIAGDRRWAFVRDAALRSGFPWLTLRESGHLRHYRPSFVEPAHPERSAVAVHTPWGDTCNLADPALAHELWPEGAQLVRQDRGTFDTFPLSLITTQTLASLGSLLGQAPDVRRFRPNILVEGVGGAFPEDEWVGHVLRVGGVRMRLDKRDGRCVVITIDPDSGERNPAVLQAVAEHRQGCLGVYASTVEPGEIRLGDGVWIESGD